MRRFILMGVMVVLGGVGCTTPVTPTLLPTPTQNPDTQPTPTVLAAPVDMTAPASTPADTTTLTQAAIDVAAGTLNLAPGEFSVVNRPLFVEWADTSLGCPQPDATYEDVTTPGYLITLTARGDTYAVHTDENGEGVVCLAEGQAPQQGVRDPIVAEFIVQAREQVAAETRLPLDEVVLVRSEAVQWSSSALGCAPPADTDVLNVVTPGYRIELIADETRYFFHASQQRMIQCDEPLE